MSKFIKGITAACLACSLTVAASAENNSEIIIDEQGFRTITVTYDDLDMSTAAGQKALSNRVRAAVRKVCGGTTGRQSLSESQGQRSCTSEASQNAMASLAKQTSARLAANF